MLAYLLRRLAYAIPIILGVNLLTFILFFVVNRPQDQAREALGGKNVGKQKIRMYLMEKGYDKPRFYNGKKQDWGDRFTQTVFFQKYVRLIAFDFGLADTDDHSINRRIAARMLPSLSIAIPVLILGLLLDLGLSMIVAYYRGTYLDIIATVLCVILMSISSLFYIIGLQYVLGKELRIIPVSGWGTGWDNWRFALGAVTISLIMGIGGAVRFYRTIFLEELNRDYIRTARSKGLSSFRVLYGHGLRNALIPVVTGVVASLPFLFMGSLLLENFFAIPGLGNYTIDALHAKDFSVVRAMVYLGSILTIVGFILTDIAYAIVDPRISFSGGATGRGRMWTVYVGVLVFTLLIAFVGHITDPMKNGVDAYLELQDQISMGWGPRVSEFLSNPSVQVYGGNIATAAVVVLFIVLIVLASRREYWRIAAHQVRQRKLAMASMAILSVYLALALCDSISWRDTACGPDGKAIINPKTGNEELMPPMTILDRAWLWTWDHVCVESAKRQRADAAGKLSAAWEKTYSAPLSDVLFQKITNPDTGKRDYPPLAYPGSHILGTDRAGVDTFYRCLKGVRTGLVIGMVTTLLALPFAMLFGIFAGYFGGSWGDDLVQYAYSTLSAIPGILLITAFILIFGQGLSQVCVILGITGWVGLCRLLRGESLKLREMEYVQAARAVGVGNFRIMLRHLAPNLMHIVLINAVLAFSGLVLAEATLSYLGVGVGPETGSWGNMINDARMELARDPMVWWSLVGAFVFMFFLILPANLFADAVRDALDPRLRTR